MSLFSNDCPSSDSENDADYVPEYSSDEEPLPSNPVENETKTCVPESNEKVNADDLFKSFLAECETEMKSREAESGIVPSPGNSVSTASEVSTSAATYSSKVSKTVCDSSAELDAKKESPPNEKNDIKVFDFAGETVCVSKDGGSVSVVNEISEPDKKDKKPVVKSKGLASVLGIIENKKPKLSTLEKSKLDWMTFKRQAGIEEELKTFNKGKSGFIERKRFLEKCDLKTFEIERDMRLSKKKK